MDTQPSPLADDSLPTRRSLLVKLRDWQDGDAWSDFVRTYDRLVRGLARKRGLSEHDAEEVAQEVFKRVAQTIHTYEPQPRRGSFRKWLGQLATWKTEDKRRREDRHEAAPLHRDGEDEPGSAPEATTTDDPAAELEQVARRELLHAALHRLRLQISEQHLQIYQLHVIEDWPVSKVAGFFRVSAGQVYVIKNRVGKRLREELSSLRAELE
jgi:RNA polymerase sigma factor (sigma-70 family)